MNLESEYHIASKSLTLKTTNERKTKYCVTNIEITIPILVLKNARIFNMGI